MIGQKELIETLQRQITSGTFPLFSIFVGAKGSGKKLIANMVCKLLHEQSVVVSANVDGIREMINLAYRAVFPTTFIIADADTLSLSAKNAILKVAEEPPKNTRIILTLTDINNTLPTIRSRGIVYRMNAYSYDELLMCAAKKRNIEYEEEQIIGNICDTPGDVEILMSTTILDFYQYVKKVIENIETVSTANVFKISDKISLKSGADGYDLKLFWRAFSLSCLEKLQILSDDSIKYAEWIKITNKYLTELRNISINKQSTFDMWLLDIRGVHNGY